MKCAATSGASGHGGCLDPSSSCNGAGVRELRTSDLRKTLFLDPTTPKSKAYPELLRIARAAAALSYAPYSKRPAGAAVWLYDGTVLTGSRFENVGYTLSSDPEAEALGRAVSSGLLNEAVASRVKPTEFVRAIAYVVPGRPRAFPSGSSRQCMCDFGLNIDIIADGGEGVKPVVKTLGALLPGAFVPDVLSYWTAG
jgi:cytidine deaminase